MPEITLEDEIAAVRRDVRKLEKLRVGQWAQAYERDLHIYRSILARLEASRWRSIAEAPRDGTRILLGYYTQGEAVVAHWNADIEKFVLTDNDKFGIAGRSSPRGWMPLPFPPSTTSEGENLYRKVMDSDAGRALRESMKKD
jgi:hypothetical protein